MTTHDDHRFSVTIQTEDLAVVGCLGALAKFSQKTGNNNIPWGGTKDDEWRRGGRRVTFGFSSPSYREGYLAELKRLLPIHLWTVVATSDTDPAIPQR